MRLQFEEKNREARDKEKIISNKIKEIESYILKNPDDPLNPYRHIMNAFFHLDTVEIKCHLQLDSLQLRGPGPFDEKVLNEARGQFSTAVMCLEKIVGRIIDADPDEIKENQRKVEKFNPARVLALHQKFKDSFALLENGAKQRQTWYQRVRWNLSELEGRYVTGIKNLLNLRSAYEAESKPYYPFADEIRTLFATITRQIDRCAENYRSKYNLAQDKVIEDLRIAIQYLEALKRIYLLMNRQVESEKTNEKLNMWQRQMETDLNKKDKKKPTK